MKQPVSALPASRAKWLHLDRIDIQIEVPQLSEDELRAYCKPSDEVKGLLRTAIQQLGLSARAYDRMLKVSRTIADLEGTKDIHVAHVAEAIQYRSLDRKFWGN